jgi:uncharacterized protein (DUF58 family)
MLKRWVAYYLFLLLSLVFALLYPGNTSSAFFYALLLMPLMSLGLSALLLSGFRYDQHVDAFAASKGETVKYRLTAGNRGLMLLPYVEVSFYGADSLYKDEFAPRRLALPPRCRGRIDISLPCRFKGAYEIGVRQIVFKDFLGLFTFRQNVAKLGDLVVYPRIVPLESFHVMAGYAGEPGEAAGRGHDRTENISDIRKYTRGDRLRSIHWKLSAKKEELMVKNFEQASGASMLLLIDASGAGEGLAAMELEDRLVECAVALIYHCARHSIPAELHFMGDRLVRQTVAGMNDFELAFRMLSEAAFRKDDGLPGIAGLVQDEGSARKTVAFVTASLTENAAGQLLVLLSGGYDVVVVHVPPAQEPGCDRERPAQSLREAGARVIRVAGGTDVGAAFAHGAG